MMTLAVDWADVAAGLLAFRPRTRFGYGVHHAPAGIVRFEAGGGLLVRGISWRVEPAPTRPIYCDGRPFLVTGQAPAPTLALDTVVGPTDLVDAWMERHGKVGPDTPAMVIDVGTADTGLAFHTWFRLTVESALLRQVGERTTTQDMTMVYRAQVVSSHLYHE